MPIRFTNLKEHIPQQSWDVSTFNDNLTEFRRLENEFYGNGKDTYQVDPSYITRGGSYVTLIRTVHARVGEWGYINVHFKLSNSVSGTAEAGAVNIVIARMSGSENRPEHNWTPLAANYGRWAMGNLNSDGEITLRNIMGNISPGNEYRLVGWYRLWLRGREDATAISPQPSTFSLSGYNSSLDQIDTRMNRMGRGNRTFDREPIRTSGIFNPTSLLEEVGTEPSYMIRFGDVCQVSLVGKLTKDIKSGAWGQLVHDLYNIPNNFSPRYASGLGSSGISTTDQTEVPAFASIDGNKIRLQCTNRANTTYHKGLYIRLAGTFLLKDG